MPVDFSYHVICQFYELKDGESCIWWHRGGDWTCLIVAHPDHEPKVVYPDGREEILRSYPSEE